MKSIKWRIFIYAAVFIATAAMTYMFVMYKPPAQAKGASQMGKASLPVVCAESPNGRKYNYMHGYTCEVDQKLLRDMITPMGSERILKIDVLPYDSNVSGIAYEVRSLDGEELIEAEEVSNYTGEDGVVKAELKFAGTLEAGTEYMLKIIVHTEQSDNACYYSRIVVTDDADVDSKLDYVDNFSQYTLSDEGLNIIKNKLETSSKGDNTNLGRVNIYCKLSQVGYAGLAPRPVSQRYLTLNEINGKRASVTVNYKAETSDDTGTYRYDIKEYLRIFQPDSTVTYVYNYDRWMNQDFEPENAVSSDGEIYLGICSSDDVHMKAAPAGKYTCFVRNNELWRYNSTHNEFVRIFSFKSDNTTDDLRGDFGEHEIRILDVDDDGNVKFVVFGYMNRGLHEGNVGISVFSYNNADNKSSEVIFIPRTDTFKSIQKDMDTVLYINDSDILYMYNNQSIYYIDCTTKECMVVANRVIESLCMMCEDTKLLIYQTDDGNGGLDVLHVLHLDTGVIFDIKASYGSQIKALGYIDGNPVFGEAYSDMVVKDDGNGESFPVYKITIMDSEHSVVRKYQKDNVYVTDLEFTEGKINLTCASVDESGYLQPVSDDQILSSIKEEEKALKVTERATDSRQKEKYISLLSVADNRDSTLKNSKYIYPADTVINIVNSAEKKNSYYYAYGFGSLYRICDNLADALSAAAESGGVVVDDNGRTIWNRYKNKEKTLTLPEGIVAQSDNTKAAATDAVLIMGGMSADSAASYENGMSTAAILKKKFGNVLDLRGSSIDTALYYVDKGYPLIAQTGVNEYQLVYGYTSDSVLTVDFTSGDVKTYSKSDFDGIIATYGSYIMTAEY